MPSLVTNQRANSVDRVKDVGSSKFVAIRVRSMGIRVKGIFVVLGRSRERVNELEQKLESLVAMMAPTQADASGLEDNTTPNVATYTEHLMETPDNIPQNTMVPQAQYPSKPWKTFQSFGGHPFSIPSTTSFTIFDDLQDVIARGLVTLEKAEDSVQHFRNTASNSPFVIISPDTSIDYLRRQKPFLLLTVLAMATINNMKLQKLLDQEIRDTLGRRVFMSGEKSLDLLQGILIYLTWHHFFFEPEHQQIYQLCQLANSMAIDLEITTSQRDRKHTPSTSFNLLSVIAESPVKLSSSQDAEAKRAFLGCYYITSTLCIGLRKPNNIKYTTYTEECCQVLAAAQEFESDALIPYFVRLQKLAHDINQTFDYDGHQDLASLDPVRVEMLVKAFRQQLTEFEKTFPAEIWKHDMLRLTYYHLCTFVNEVGFHKTVLPPPDLRTDQSSYHTWCSSITRSEVLISCLNAAKDYLERYLSLPTEALFNATFADHAKLVYNVLILKLFATWVTDDDENSTLDAAHIQHSANFLFYTQALVCKFERMGKIYRDCGLLEDYTLYLAQLFRIYGSRARDEMMGDRLFPGNAGSLNMSVMQMLPSNASYHGQLSDASSSTITQMQEDAEEQWADMLVRWSPSLDPQDLSSEALFT
ncbi:Transcriptional regulator WAR1 [Lachnellula arida]|uniref:Transcriptional regulator WAR1 n=1 Tax=Lachnellula arida TaxID=1316785 RepID=A0A8T9B905_9HELO|nr:Transcriptional regulator WAR1 [Lachnellula arida]